MEITWLENGQIRLDAPIVLHLPLITVSVPAGYVSNGASIPRPLWPIVGHPFQSEFVTPAIIHDYFCDEAAKRGDYHLRVIGDSVFFYLLRDWGVPYWKRAAMYFAVRFWGRWTFRGK